MRKVFIIGSCVSRDVFNVENNKLEVVSYNARSSFARIGNSQVVSNHFYSGIQNLPSAFQRRMVLNDFNNQLISRVNTTEKDIILVDFIDERFHLVQLGDAIVTRSKEFTLTNINPDRLINTYSQEYLALWKAGIDFFLKNIANNQLIVIPKVFWSNKIIGQEQFSERVLQDIDKQNEKLITMYDYLEKKSLNNLKLLEINEDLLRVDSKHRWGLSPYHYSDEYSEYVNSLLSEI